MSRRIKDEIIPRIIEDNSEELLKPTSPLRSEAFMMLNDLKSSLEFGRSAFLRGISDSGPDLDVWDEILFSVPNEERNWLDSPWIISEFYFYRRVMEVFKFFETQYDPFTKQKVNGLLEALSSIEDVASRLPGLLEQDVKVATEIAIKTSLWGNKMDLSLWPASKQSSNSGVAETHDVSYGATIAAGRQYLLDDHTEEAINQLMKAKASGKPVDVAIIVDNAGYELVTDLLLGHVLLALNVADTVTFHTKAHPTFVSDATTSDVLYTIDALKSSQDGVTRDATAAVANTMQSYVDNKRFRVVDDLFWCQPTAMWDMPSRVQKKFSDSAITFVKGDANYRRLLGDREWPLDKPADSVLSYWKPMPVCALRTCKAELGCGIPVSEQERAAAEDPNWLVSGRWGVVQVGGL
eukprot:CAMPEP_0182429444 /NCGR_PEP_ID=MMETSP1167-20130531/28964_1 /TAXON_ID=2988 /ORGANISM="Mallomonas Sp, Strain CCMP3275" /LENGTH=407 /DNA_ID=CAMNT_0024613153 /DNA_START=169 /DNA_END=1392 /DNA_ORIENTATION=+